MLSKIVLFRSMVHCEARWKKCWQWSKATKTNQQWSNCNALSFAYATTNTRQCCANCVHCAWNWTWVHPNWLGWCDVCRRWPMRSRWSWTKLAWWCCASRRTTIFVRRWRRCSGLVAAVVCLFVCVVVGRESHILILFVCMQQRYIRSIQHCAAWCDHRVVWCVASCAHQTTRNNRCMSTLFFDLSR